MKKQVAIVDYGAGNLKSLENAFLKIGVSTKRFEHPDQLLKNSHVVLPGVGAFGVGWQALQKKGFVEALEEFRKSGKPFLGICLGMQFLFEDSVEYGCHKGFGWVSGHVVAIADLKTQNKNLKIPHMGWNNLQNVKDSQLFEDVPIESDFYFVHSYYAKAKNQETVLATTRYAENDLTAVVQNENIWGCQFHPEKSQSFGLKILENFLNF